MWQARPNDAVMHHVVGICWGPGAKPSPDVQYMHRTVRAPEGPTLARATGSLAHTTLGLLGDDRPLLRSPYYNHSSTRGIIV